MLSLWWEAGVVTVVKRRVESGRLYRRLIRSSFQSEYIAVRNPQITVHAPVTARVVILEAPNTPFCAPYMLANVEIIPERPLSNPGTKMLLSSQT